MEVHVNTRTQCELLRGKSMQEEMNEMEEDPAPAWLRAFIEKKPRPRQSPWLRDGVSMYYYQDAGLESMTGERDRDKILAFSMGTGKTNMTLEYFARIIYGDTEEGEGNTYPTPSAKRKCLLILPPPLFETWTSAIRKYFRPGTFRMLVIDSKERSGMASKASIYRQSLLRSPSEFGANLVIISRDWLVAIATHACRRLNCKVSPHIVTRDGAIFIKTGKASYLETGYRATQMKRFLRDRRMQRSVAIRRGEAPVEYLTDIDVQLWGDIITGRVRPLGASPSYTVAEAQRWAFLGEVHWECVAMDEAHRINNEGTRLLAVMDVIRTRSRIYATGTPVETGDRQLRTLMRSLGCVSPEVVERRNWRDAINRPVLSSAMRALIDRYLIFLPKCVIEEAYCKRRGSVHRRAKALGYAVPTTLLKSATVQTEKLPVRTQPEVDVCNYVLNQLFSHVPRWAEEARERADQRKRNAAIARARKKRLREEEIVANEVASKRHKSSSSSSGEEDEREDNTSSAVAVAADSEQINRVPSMADVQVSHVPGAGSMMRSEWLTPLEGARHMRNLCFSPRMADPRTLVAEKHLSELVDHDARIEFVSEEWNHVEETEERGAYDVCSLTYRLLTPNTGRGTQVAPTLRTSLVSDPLLPRKLVEATRAAGNSAKIECIVRGVAESPASWKHVVFVRYYSQIYLLLEAFRDSMAGLSPLVLYGCTPPAARTAVVEEFKRARHARVLIASPDVAGVGLDFSFATVAWIPMPHFNPARDEQCADRVNRLGRPIDAAPAHVRYLVLADSLEENILSKRQHRSHVSLFLMGATHVHPNAVRDSTGRLYMDTKAGTADAIHRRKQMAIIDAIRGTNHIALSEVPAESLLHFTEQSDEEESYDDDDDYDDDDAYVQAKQDELFFLKSPESPCQKSDHSAAESDGDSDIEAMMKISKRDPKDTMIFLDSIMSDAEIDFFEIINKNG